VQPRFDGFELEKLRSTRQFTKKRHCYLMMLFSYMQSMGVSLTLKFPAYISIFRCP
jgi:hypothetical protein